MACPQAGGELARRVVARAFEGGDEFRANLIGFAADARAEPGDNVSAIGAEPLHRRHRRLDHPRQCAAPTTRARWSANKIMPQSAPVTPSAKPGVAVTRASHRGRASTGQSSAMARASGE